MRLVALLVVSACGGGGTADDVPDDAPAVASIAETACGSEVATIDTLASRFDPATATISMGEVVAFDTGQIGDSHDIIPNSANATGLAVREGQVKCFRFTATGTFGFKCSVHGFTGTIVVQ